MIRPLVLTVTLLVLGTSAALAQAAPEASEVASGLAGDAALSRLLDVLQDDTARATLVAALEDAGTADGVAPTAVEAVPAEEPVLAQRLALAGLSLADVFRAEAERLWLGLLGLRDLLGRLPAVGPDELRTGTVLLATILATVAAALAFGVVTGAMARRLKPRSDSGGLRRVGRALLALLAHLAGVALAWAAGNAVAVLLFSNGGRLLDSQVLYLDAFLAFGTARVALRAVANPDAAREPTLSLLRPAAQRAIYRGLRPTLGILTQGFLFVVPLIHLWAGFAAARPARTLVATTAAVAALWAVWHVHRVLDATRPSVPSPEPVLAGLPPPPAGPATAVVAEGLGLAWRRAWPPLAVIYVLYAWAVAITRPALADRIVVGGTAATLLAVLLVALGLHLLGRARLARAPLPAPARAALPTLQPRADRIAAALTAALGVAALLAAPILALLGWDGTDAVRARLWPVLRGPAGQAASAALVVLGAAVLWALVASLIDARLARSEGLGPADGAARAARSRTLLALFRNAFTVALATVAGMVALSQVGLDIAPLLAGAGVVGLAVGFGAQTLVKDIITGVFIQLEGAIDVGDVVTVAGISGTVERITVRSVRLRAQDGTANVVPFSSVTTVSNMTRDHGYHVASLVVGYGTPVPAARAAMEEAFARLASGPQAAGVQGGLDMQGVAEMRDNAFVVRARIRTAPGRQWEVGRRYSEILTDVLEERGLEVPTPAGIILLPHEAPTRGAAA